MEFGNVQRGVLGVAGSELNGPTSKELGIKETQGYYISKIIKNSGAEKAGLKKGDVIVKLDNQPISTYPELTGYISTKRPNDKVQVTVIRDGRNQVIPVTLVKNDIINTDFKGLELENIDGNDKKRFKIDYGVKIKEVNNDRLKPYEKDLTGSIILTIDGTKATDVESVSKLANDKDENQGVSIEMINKMGQIIRIII
jgi:S1-C subfamily serine protease